MSKIWSDENRYQKWLAVEIAACKAMVQAGLVPAGALENIERFAQSAEVIDVGAIEAIEKVTKHDVLAFLTYLAEHIGEDARFLHLGLTSSDILDTSFALLLREAGGLLDADLVRLLELLEARAWEYKETLMIGRSHGIHAEPITFGLKLALWHEELKRGRGRLGRALEGIAYGKFSGAVGTYSFVTPAIEEDACTFLGLKPAPISSQIIQRDRHAEFFCVLAIIASSLDKFAQEIRLLQRTEVREVEEFFAPGQKGSSAMPHKRNPILSENLSGLARLLRGYALSALENIPLWHERDISHSSVERVIAPDATIALDFMLGRFYGIMEKLIVYPQRMKKNLEITNGVIFSQLVMLKLVEKGISREEAYAVTQENAMRCWQEGVSLLALLEKDQRVASLLDGQELRDIFNPQMFLKYVDYTFERVFGR